MYFIVLTKGMACHAFLLHYLIWMHGRVFAAWTRWVRMTLFIIWILLVLFHWPQPSCWFSSQLRNVLSPIPTGFVRLPHFVYWTNCAKRQITIMNYRWRIAPDTIECTSWGCDPAHETFGQLPHTKIVHGLPRPQRPQRPPRFASPTSI